MAELLLFPSPIAPSPAQQTCTEDAEARRSALDASQSFIVEAPAGSGKTGLLIQRFLKLLAAENVSTPEQVLAITFTRKATVEMRDRVFAQLHAANSGAAPANEFDRLTRPLAEAAVAQDRRLGWNLLDYPRRLNIRTIDSISAEIARSLPILSGAAAGLAPTDESSPLYAEAARRTVMLLGGEDQALSHALETVLIIRDANLENVEKLIAEMLQWRDQWGELIPIATADLDDQWLEANVLPKLQRALDLVICRGLTQLTKALPADFLRELCALAAEMGHLEGYKGSPSPIAICAGRYELPEEKSEHLEHWRALLSLLLTADGSFRKGALSNHVGFSILAEHKVALLGLIDRIRENSSLCAALCAARALPPARYPQEQWDVTKALFRVLSRALVELLLVFAERSLCDFAEMGLLARDALRRDDAVEDLNLATGLSLQHLLVDEMQDTSTSQYELIELLTRRWDGHSQTVFLVGDPKQSIYLFRQARVERFVQTMLRGTLGDLPLTALHLTANFRSQQGLVEAYNGDFTRLFPAEPDPEQPELVPYLPAQPTRLGSSQPSRIWHTALLPYVDETEERAQRKTDQRIEDARNMRRVIEEWHDRPLPPDRAAKDEAWTIAILVRNRIHLAEIVAALKQDPPIPFRAIDIEPLGTRQEILDLLALTRALLHPADRTAWLGLLRTPWCGLTLADIHQLAGADDESLARHTILELIDLRGPLLSDDGSARLAPFNSVMRAAVAQRGRLRLAPWVERTWRSFHAHAFATPEELANIDRFFNLLEQLEQPGGHLDLALLATRLTRLYAAPSTQPGAVDLMTIHGSKGLEWDVVIVPALERLAPVQRTRLLAWMEINGSGDASDDSIAHGILAPIQGKGQVSQQLNTWMRGIGTAREAAERKRLFYVACTRAREELHLYAAPMRKKDGSPSIHPSSLLASALPAVAEHFDASLLTMPAPSAVPDDTGILPSLAASAQLLRRPRIIERIPLNTVLEQPRPLPYGSPERQTFTLFDRPEGSFAARAFGNAVHAFLEQLTLARAASQSFDSLLLDLPSWQPRITQTLRANGLAPAQLERPVQRALLALRNALTTPEGQWILSPHPEATTESSLTIYAENLRNIRVDRSFRAGAEPLSTGTDHQWIIDYKTATPGGRELSLFLEEERAKYAPQMQTYSDAQSGSEAEHLRLALYYPLIPALICY